MAGGTIGRGGLGLVGETESLRLGLVAKGLLEVAVVVAGTVA